MEPFAHGDASHGRRDRTTTRAAADAHLAVARRTGVDAAAHRRLLHSLPALRQSRPQPDRSPTRSRPRGRPRRAGPPRSTDDTPKEPPPPAPRDVPPAPPDKPPPSVVPLFPTRRSQRAPDLNWPPTSRTTSAKASRPCRSCPRCPCLRLPRTSLRRRCRRRRRSARRCTTPWCSGSCFTTSADCRGWMVARPPWTSRLSGPMPSRPWCAVSIARRRSTPVVRSWPSAPASKHCWRVATTWT